MTLSDTSPVDLGRGAWIQVYRGFIPDHEAVMARLLASLPLRRERLRLFGKEQWTPRLTSWHGDPYCTYSYSGRRFTPKPWTEDLRAIRDDLNRQTGVSFNSVLANLYRDGNDAMGAHADDEKELGPSPYDVRIASVSLGARRRFCLRAKAPAKPHRNAGKPPLSFESLNLERLDFDLGEGDLLIMGGTTQEHFRHHAPRTKRLVGPRLNLTYRVFMGPIEYSWTERRNPT